MQNGKLLAGLSWSGMEVAILIFVYKAHVECHEAGGSRVSGVKARGGRENSRGLLSS